MIKSKLFLAFYLAAGLLNAQVINTVAGNGTSGYSGDTGPATSAEISGAVGVVFDASGNMYFVANSRIRKVSTSGIITTIAGNGSTTRSGDGGSALSAGMAPSALVIDASGNFYVGGNSCIRKIDHTTGIITTIAGTGSPGHSGDGGLATSATFAYVNGMALDGTGVLYFTDEAFNDVRKVNLSTGYIYAVAGTTAGYSGDGGSALSAQLYYPTGLACDASNNLYIADQGTNRVRWINVSTGIINTYAGIGPFGTTGSYSGDGGPANAAGLNNPNALAFDASGNLYISDLLNNRIRKVTASTGVITTVAGNGTSGYSGDGGLPTSAEINTPNSVALNAGVLYISDCLNNRIRAITPPLCSANAGSNVTDYNNGGSLCAGVQIGTPAISGLTYSWLPTSGLSCNNCAQPTCSYNNTVTPQAYTVTVSGTSCATATSSVLVSTVTQTLTASISNIHSINGSNITAVGHYSANFTPTYYFWSITQCTSTGGSYSGGYSWNSGYIAGAPSGTYAFPSTSTLPCNTYYQLWFWTGNSCAGEWATGPIVYTTLDANTVLSSVLVSTGNHSVTATYPSDNPSGISYWWDVVELDAGGSPITTTEINNPGCWWTYPASTAPNSFNGYENNAYSATLCAAGDVGNFTSPNSYQISFGVWSSTCAWTEKVQILAYCGAGCRTEQNNSEYVISENLSIPHHSSYLDAMQSSTSINNLKRDGSSLLDIYPNPSKGTFIVETSTNLPQLLQVFDISGKMVLSQNINGKTTIDASILSDGVYNINITGNNSVANKKLVIVK